MEKLLAAKPKDAVRSKTPSGKPARLLKTAWTEAWLRDDCSGTLSMADRNFKLRFPHRRY